jgi:hypothetical protein
VAGRDRRKSLSSNTLRRTRIFQEKGVDKTIKDDRILEKEKMMIKIELTVREAMDLAIYCPPEMREKIVTALEVMLGVNQRRTVTITRGMTTDNRIQCIKAVRKHTGWGLKEAKDWTDQMVGRYNEYGRWCEGVAASISVNLKTPDAAENLLRDLADCGCEGYLS